MVTCWYYWKSHHLFLPWKVRNLRIENLIIWWAHDYNMMMVITTWLLWYDDKMTIYDEHMITIWWYDNHLIIMVWWPDDNIWWTFDVEDDHQHQFPPWWKVRSLQIKKLIMWKNLKISWKRYDGDFEQWHNRIIWLICSTMHDENKIWVEPERRM